MTDMEKNKQKQDNHHLAATDAMAASVNQDALTQTLAIPPLEIEEEFHLINRELSWLAFNERVLAEADNTHHPLLERLRFLAISASNLDEFFMVRVAGLKHLVTRGNKLDYYNSFVSPQRQLKEIDARIRHLLAQQQVILPVLFDALSDHGVSIVSPEQLNEADKAHVKSFIFNEVIQIITPQTLDPAHPFPFIANEGLGMFLI
jgi:polyphosphate kinase